MKRLYGAGPAHLVLLLASFALVAYAGSFVLADPGLWTMLIWFVGAAVVHDLVLFPLYALADRALERIGRQLPHPPVRVVNHVRVPLLGAGLTFVMFLPGIIRQGEDTHLAATSLSQQPYLGRWLWLVLAMFVVSGLSYVMRLITNPTESRRIRSAADLLVGTRFRRGCRRIGNERHSKARATAKRGAGSVAARTASADDSQSIPDEGT